LLDVAGRERLSRLPWKGQFTPEFVDVLLDAYAPPSGSVLDPFAGSGTVLFEAASRGLCGIGAEVNDAAIALSRVVELWQLPRAERVAAVSASRRLLSRWPEPADRQATLWQEEAGDAAEVLAAAALDPACWRLVSAAAVLAQATRSSLARRSMLEAIDRLQTIVLEVTDVLSPCVVHHSDARSLPVPADSIDLVITSPPYINVHNYHQYARAASELLGGSPLKAARSEIGANRKFRQNRFLTVIQYAIDMERVLVELRRVVRSAARLVIVIGRESTVRGLTFENGGLLADLVTREGSFRVERRLERSFLNRFGARIFEDILELAPGVGHGEEGVGRQVGIDHLSRALDGPSDLHQRRDLELALKQAAAVQPSPIFSASVVLPVAA
jgi:16S rRNA G966 N2-methylase RsmD